MKVKINIKKFSRKENQIEQIIYDYPDSIKSVRDLIKETVKIGVSEYNDRVDNKQLLQVLTKDDIDDKKATGKIDFSVNYGQKKQVLHKAIENAWQCFEDGIVVIFLNEEKLEGIDEKIDLKEDSELTFVRMTMLSGRLW